jgi:ABC-type branched-subunit amino acid transport system substrate-binding protein
MLRFSYRCGWPVGAARIAVTSAGVLLLALGAGVKGEEPLSPPQALGAMIYHQGSSPSGADIVAQVGGVTLPGSAVPCASCHGPDGLGRPEGGVRPSPLTWGHLTKPYGHRHRDGRSHPPFTALSLKQAITTGVDPAGNAFDPAMPRYAMPDEELDALVAYLEVVGLSAATGVSSGRVVLGLLMPENGPSAMAGRAAAQVISGRLGEVNAEGGIYGRQVELRTVTFAPERQAALQAADLLVQAPVLAIIGALPSPLQLEVADHLEELGVPLFHLWPPPPEDIPESRRYGFYLLPGVRQEAERLLDHADALFRPRRPRAAVVLPPGAAGDALAGAVLDRARHLGWPEPLEVTMTPGSGDAAAIVDTLRSADVEVAVVLASGSLPALVKATADVERFPLLLMPGSLLDEPPGSRLLGRAVLALPLLPSDWEAEHLEKLAALRAGEQGRSLLAGIAAYGVTTVLIEALKSAGRDLTRAAFLAAVEAIHDLPTGLTPPLSYGPARRIGVAEPRILRQ